MPALITRDLVALDADLGAERRDVIRALAGLVVDAGRATSVDDLFADAWAREQKTDTGVPGGIAIPHCRSVSVQQPTLAMARLRPPVDFGAFDGPADIVFLIAAPDGADQLHLQLLAKLARSLIDEDFTAALRSAASPDAIVALVERATSDEPAPAPAAPTAAAGESARPVLVGVTSCATGIAHTYMAADALTNAAKKLGVDLHIETQGSAGSTPLDPGLIERAGAVIFANDVDVRDRGRFAGKPVVQAPVKRGIDHPEDMVREALAAASDPNAARVQGGSSGAATAASAGGRGVGAEIRRILLTGVSYMIPFVAGGGLLIAVGFLLAGFSPLEGYKIVLPGPGTGALAYNDWALQKFTLFDLPPQGLFFYLGAAASKIGQLSLGFLVPALAGYIAYAIADRPGIAPGFVVGSVSGYLGAGFIGGIVGGLLAGYSARLIGRPAVPKWLRGLMPVVIIPLGASIIASGLMLLVLGGPIAALTRGLNTTLTGMTGSAAVLLGVVLGLMMCFDLGGPINKVAYAFAVAGLGAGATNANLQIMATVMAAGMVPPLGMALASTVLYRRGFSEVERENGAAAWLLGASFISEGAIPFAAADPLRVIPSNLVGGAVTGALTMAFAVTSRAPHGGVFVFFAIDNFFLWLLAIVVGTAVTAFVLVGLKRFVRPGTRTPVEEPATASSSPQPVGAAA